VDSTWTEVATTVTVPAGVSQYTLTSGADTYKKSVVIKNSVASTVSSTGVIPSTRPLSKISVEAFFTPTAGPSAGTALFAANDVTFAYPVIYQKGGTICIAASANYLFISSYDKEHKQFTPGLGVTDFVPYAINPTFDIEATDSYYATKEYPTWIYMSMVGTSNITTCYRYNVDSGLNDVGVKNRLQIKSPYVTNITKATIAIPATTLNANLKRSLLCARFEVHNKFATDKGEVANSTSLYDIGGDVSMIAPIFLTCNGRTLDTLDVLMPNHNIMPDMADLSDDEKALYTSYYGHFIIWGSKYGSLGSPGVKYAIRLG
jgi:hypothetical protein